jgi:hypothetical protein
MLNRINKGDPEILWTSYLFNKTISRPPQSREIIPLKASIVTVTEPSLFAPRIRVLWFFSKWSGSFDFSASDPGPLIFQQGIRVLWFFSKWSGSFDFSARDPGPLIFQQGIRVLWFFSKGSGSFDFSARDPGPGVYSKC